LHYRDPNRCIVAVTTGSTTSKISLSRRFPLDLGSAKPVEIAGSLSQQPSSTFENSGRIGFGSNERADSVYQALYQIAGVGWLR